MSTKKFALLPTDDADRVTIGIKRAARLPGAAMASRHRVLTKWGIATLLVDGESLIALDPPDRVFAPTTKKGARRLPNLTVEDGGDGSTDLSLLPANLRAFADRLVAYLEGEKVALAGAEEVASWLDAADVGGFRKLSSLKLLEIPRGTTVSYSDLAELAGRPRASRAVGTACARNPLPLVVPCHRVVPASGELGSYGFHGPTYKRALLELEGWTGNVPKPPAVRPGGKSRGTSSATTARPASASGAPKGGAQAPNGGAPKGAGKGKGKTASAAARPAPKRAKRSTSSNKPRT